jgi:hypothetical protein
MPKDHYQAMMRSLARRIKPGKNSGMRLGGEPESEAEHFYVCKACGQAVDMRDLGQVFHHEVPGHERLPEN